MSKLKLISLKCNRTRGAEDKIVLTYSSDWGPFHYIGRGFSNFLTGQRSLDVGDSATLNIERDIEYAALITLKDSGSNDFIGAVMITPRFENLGERTETIEREGYGSYELIFEVVSDDVNFDDDIATIRLLRLDCENAQEREDEPVLYINGEEVWSGNLRSEEFRRMNVSRTFRSSARIDLMERDRGRSDAFGSVIIDRSQQGEGNKAVNFIIDSGIVGDARYRLVYAVE